MTIEEDLLRAVAKDGVIPVAGLLALLMSSESSIGFGIKTVDGKYQLANQALQRLLCPHAGQLLGKSEGELLPAQLQPALLRGDRSIVGGAAAASERIELAANGRRAHYRWLKLPVIDPDGKLRSIASIVYQQTGEQAQTADQQTFNHLQQINQELQQAVAELEQLASTDKLTGAWNRRRLEECVCCELGRFERYQHPLSVLIIDIDLFKAINDQHGHHTGDQVLRTLTTLLQGGLRSADSLARWGGEEFVILCPDTNRLTAAKLAERLRTRVAETRLGPEGELTISIGVAECRPGEPWEQWFQRADEALYQAKTEGRNQVKLAPELVEPDGIGPYLKANLVQLVWRTAYECGNEVIDRGHRLLFANANALLAAILSGKAAEDVDTLVDELLSDVVQHFQDEEAIFVAAGFPGAREHSDLHRQLIETTSRLGGDYRAGTLNIGGVFQFLAHDVITKHMLGADRKFFDHLRQNASPSC